MSDPAHEATDKIIKEIEKRLTKEYAVAIAEIEEKLADYMAAFQKKDETWRKWVKSGQKTQKEYQEWRVGQIAIGQRWEEMKQTLATDMAHVNEIARSTVNGYMPEVYAINHDYGTYEVETGALVDTSYTLYNRQAAEHILMGNQIYHAPGRKIAQQLAIMADIQWNKTQVQSVMLQALYQGDSIPDIATRLAKEVGEKNRGAAIRNARTMATGVQNAGREDSYRRAESMGIKMKQQWLATLDNRTRHSHRMLDGETVEVGGTFSNGCRYPGDPNGAPSEIYNCRCTMIASIEGFERDVTDLSLRNTNHMEGMTYEEWRKEKAVSHPIDKQDRLADAFRWSYINEYRRS